MNRTPGFSHSPEYPGAADDNLFAIDTVPSYMTGIYANVIVCVHSLAPGDKCICRQYPLFPVRPTLFQTRARSSDRPSSFDHKRQLTRCVLCQKKAL